MEENVASLLYFLPCGKLCIEFLCLLEMDTSFIEPTISLQEEKAFSLTTDQEAPLPTWQMHH